MSKHNFIPTYSSPWKTINTPICVTQYYLAFKLESEKAVRKRRTHPSFALIFFRVEWNDTEEPQLPIMCLISITESGPKSTPLDSSKDCFHGAWKDHLLYGSSDQIDSTVE